jgi:hypothetical protein
MTHALISKEREAFHRRLLGENILSISEPTKKVKDKFKKTAIEYIASNADAGSTSSIKMANALIEKIANNIGVTLEKVVKKEGQTLGHEFESVCQSFVSRTFTELNHLRPGDWEILKLEDRNGAGIGAYEQYSHLRELSELAEKYDELRTFLGDGYTVAPDVIVFRYPVPDALINQSSEIVDAFCALKAPLREQNQNPVLPLLHASLSCKFTMRSDRAQNSRTEALNLLRSRKGRAPHIASITAEPTPSRIASLALGTGDLDCVYHIALYELREVILKLEDETALDLLDTMINGKRLRDISDLPLDLAV